ncbi:RNA polymerase sigma factor [Mucilaginibacter sp. UR6-11]|uniref:RNA polymerase sigma factor n=1 Tax=Mucilaginibacter sp. UR6-11 TaxID=1435644 RepID=UPI001E65A784|nr:sigma-70 family RNA polymerase sigma factor [Mucilaginibacter sp. UR6-11]MCC8423627.1 sigma-70 family RNA polymerase sigma factor [Mucilaginibacter sp. UR6-11]
MFDEREVISGILAGHRNAFASLVSQYERLVFTVVNRLIDEKDETEDVCQEVFIKIFNGLGRFQFEAKLSTWVARIAYMTTINHVRKNKGKRYHPYPANVENYHFTADNPEKVTIHKDMSVYVNELIAQMPKQYQTVITLFHLKEFNLKEIQDITGMPEGTVKNYLFRSRQLLKEKLNVYLKNEER